MPFEKGRPKTGGKQKGSKNKSTILFAEILDKERANLLRVAIRLAKKGNATIMNKLIDKMIPNLQPVDPPKTPDENKQKTLKVEFV
jgi:hypothetical protein